MLEVLLFRPTVKGHLFHNCFPDPFPYLFPLSCFMAFVSFLSCLMVLESPAIGDALLSAFFLFSGSASGKSPECGISSAQVGVPFIMKEFAKGFYCSSAWLECRRAFISSRRGLCERCLENGIYNAGVIVHHRIHLTPLNITDPNVALNWDNLQLLCRDCHAAVHAREKRYRFDEYGRCLTAS